MKVWGFYRGTGRLAGKHQVAQALEQVGYAKVVLNAADGTVRFARPDVEIDLGGIGKGYAVDRMITVIKENGIGSALVNSGGSSIYGLGAPPGQDRGWEVNIRHPKRPSEAAAGMYLKNESISTSGSSEKSFLAEGRSYSHIMDPRTGYPAEGMLEVAVIAPRTQDSEAWTKPYFILGRRWAAQHKPRDSRVFLCEDQAEPQCLWLR
jgi:thiamine biosynthesis lipoprotein